MTSTHYSTMMLMGETVSLIFRIPVLYSINLFAVVMEQAYYKFLFQLALLAHLSTTYIGLHKTHSNNSTSKQPSHPTLMEEVNNTQPEASNYTPTATRGNRHTTSMFHLMLLYSG